MPRFRFDKLVRDKIVALQQARGAEVTFRKLSTEEHVRALLEKLEEEAREARLAASDELIEELADVQQVLDDLKSKLKLTGAQIADVQLRKNEATGGFSKGLFIEEVSLAADDPWIEHFRKNADRYPEV